MALHEDSTLKIHLDGRGPSIRAKAGMRAVITMPHLDGLSLSSETRGTVNGFESTNSFTLELSGGSSLHGAIVAGKMDCRVSGASSIRSKDPAPMPSWRVREPAT
jgi:hypothetical protein